jgi:hypothetical protein
MTLRLKGIDKQFRGVSIELAQENAVIVEMSVAVVVFIRRLMITYRMLMFV